MTNPVSCDTCKTRNFDGDDEYCAKCGRRLMCDCGAFTKQEAVFCTVCGTRCMTAHRDRLKRAFRVAYDNLDYPPAVKLKAALLLEGNMPLCRLRDGDITGVTPSEAKTMLVYIASPDYLRMGCVDYRGLREQLNWTTVKTPDGKAAFAKLIKSLASRVNEALGREVPVPLRAVRLPSTSPVPSSSSSCSDFCSTADSSDDNDSVHSQKEKEKKLKSQKSRSTKHAKKKKHA